MDSKKKISEYQCATIVVPAIHNNIKEYDIIYCLKPFCHLSVILVFFKHHSKYPFCHSQKPLLCTN